MENSRLPDIPVELFEHILDYMTPNNIRKLASTSSELKTRIFTLIPQWLEKYFSAYGDKEVWVSSNNFAPNQLNYEVYYSFKIHNKKPSIKIEPVVALDDMFGYQYEDEPQYEETTYEGLYQYLLGRVPHSEADQMVTINNNLADDKFKNIIKLISFQRFTQPKHYSYVDPSELEEHEGGTRKYYIKLKDSKPLVVRRNSKGLKYVMRNNKRIYLSTIRGKYRYV